MKPFKTYEDRINTLRYRLLCMDASVCNDSHPFTSPHPLKTNLQTYMDCLNYNNCFVTNRYIPMHLFNAPILGTQQWGLNPWANDTK